MTDNNTNQEKDKANKNFHLHEIQSELIQAKSTLKKVSLRLSQDDILANEIYEASGDAPTTSMYYLEQVIKYLEKIIVNNQLLINALAGKLG